MYKLKNVIYMFNNNDNKKQFFSEICFVSIKIHSNTNGCNFHIRTENFFWDIKCKWYIISLVFLWKM